MPACARREIVAEGEVGLYHCVSRCVRRAFLCGLDKLSGQNYAHRKRWIEERLEELAGIFGLDVCGFAVMSNHLHVVVRTRPDLAGEWSDEEVVRRWWQLCPCRRDRSGKACELEADELQELLADRQRLALWRRRLASLSWFIRCLCEVIARRANREDGVHGRFWEGRFRSQRLADEKAALACSIYVDLNPIRAGIAKTPETSKHTSAYRRIRSRQQTRSGLWPRKRHRHVATDAWLCPIGAERELATSESWETSSRHRTSNHRASTHTSEPAGHGNGPAGNLVHRSPGFLTLDVDDYLALLNWAGRELHVDKRGTIPSDIAPILERLQLQADGWLACVKNFGRWFHQAIVGPLQPRAAPA